MWLNYLVSEVGADEVLAVRGVFAHVEFEELGDVVVVAQADAVKADVFAYEVFELIGGDFAKTFESGYLRIGAEFFDGLFALFV